MIVMRIFDHIMHFKTTDIAMIVCAYIICIYYNFRLLHFPITKKPRGAMENYFTCKCIILITPLTFL